MPEPLYRRVLGPDFDRLPPEVRALHQVEAETRTQGACRIERGRGALSRLAGWLFGMPPAGESVPVEVVFQPRGEGELWRRRFGAHRLASFQAPLARRGWLAESFGPGRFLLEAEAGPQGLALLLRGVRVFGLPLPPALWPRIRAGERVEAGRFTFDVEIRLPLGGLLIHYRGHLTPADG